MTIAVATLGISASLFAQTTPGPQPTICSRSCWGARAASGCQTMSALTRVIVHHTAGASQWNSTGLSDSAAMVRSLQNYNLDVNGYCDIEYHWMIDKHGNIFEARYGGLSGALIRGAHDGNNSNSHGASLMGYFHSPYNHVAPTVMLNQLYDLIAWRMPSGWSPYGSGTYNSKTVGFLDGHRKVKATACPGDNIHPNLITENYSGGTMRNAVAQRRTPSVNNASFVSKSHPSSVTAGASFSASITMKNNGSKVWYDVTNHKLGSQSPQDNTRWGLHRVAVAGTINPNQNHTFTFNCTAPATPGTYAFDWKMVEDGVEWFGATAVGSISVVSGSVIVDNNSSGFAASSSWIAATSSADKYGADYRYRSTQAVSDNAVWTGNLPSSKTYNVYAWWPQGSNRSQTAAYHVVHAGGTTVVTVNQQANGGKWNLLGNWSMSAGNNQVKLSCWTTTGFIVVADAIQWQ